MSPGGVKQSGAVVAEHFAVVARSDSDEAIHPSLRRVDCFASLAMTAAITSHSRGAMRPEFCWKFMRSPNSEARDVNWLTLQYLHRIYQ
jgi:hypothetical protein